MKIKTAFERMIDHAHSYLPPRAAYGHDVLDGVQRWSGSDLRGEAGYWGASYDRTRGAAYGALAAAGGECVYDLSQRGLKVAALPIARDRTGEVIVWQTASGYVARVDEAHPRRDEGPNTVRPATKLHFRNGTLISYMPSS